MTRQYILTRASYGPEWPIVANLRRLKILEGVTARMMARQTCDEFTWVVLLDSRDRLLSERMTVLSRSALHFTPLIWTPGEVAPAEWDAHPIGNRRSKVAATAYKAPWRDIIGPADEPILTTRVDDDDALASDYVQRIQRAAAKLTERTVLMLPVGYRVWRDRYSLVRHRTNAMQTLFTPAGDPMIVYDYGHRLCRRVAPVKTVDSRPGWLWARHQDTLSGWKKAETPITHEVRDRFPIDFGLLR